MILTFQNLSQLAFPPKHAVVSPYRIKIGHRSKPQYRAVCAKCSWFATPTWRYSRARVEAADHNVEFHDAVQNSLVVGTVIDPFVMSETV